MLKGQKKTDYQREYMRKRRLLDPSVRPSVQPKPLGRQLLEDAIAIHGQPELDADGNIIPEY